ncbi:MAG: DUF4350 domain-containing protein [Blastocatellia bacterium]|nr:DUF4350 domain-containing protein [Blastocatellia bacterium]
MKRYFGIIATVVLVFVVLIALNAAGTITLDRPPEDEYVPVRSSYNAGPTGTRALYQLLEESGYDVARWRENYKDLNFANSSAKGASLVVVGPFPRGTELDDDEAQALRKWVAAGGNLLIVSRTPRAQFRDHYIHVQTPPPPAVSGKGEGHDAINPPVEEKSDLLISQPTELTRNVRGLMISKWASRLSFHAPAAEPRSGKEADDTDDSTAEPPPPKPAPSSAADPDATPQGVPGVVALPDELLAPVVHLGDSEGAVLADFNYGEGRVIFLSDPFVIANNGIARGTNVNLALNLMEALGGAQQKIYFDEYHHGYRSQGNALMNYFRGTPVPWLFAQLLFVAVLIAYSYGKRFARPLPMPQADRHSPLEFVGSMASLQQAAQARDLALENIYPRFRHRLCRTLGLPVTAAPQTIIARLKRRVQTRESEVELLRVFSESERALQGERLDDQRLTELVAAMRRIAAQLKLS